MNDQEQAVDPQVETAEASEQIRVSRGTVTPEIRERLMVLQAKRYLKYKEKESVQAVIDVALAVGIESLEADVRGLDPAA